MIKIQRMDDNTNVQYFEHRLTKIVKYIAQPCSKKEINYPVHGGPSLSSEHLVLPLRS